MGEKRLGPLKMSLEMAQKVIVPQKKNYVPHFPKQRDINSYFVFQDIIHISINNFSQLAKYFLCMAILGV